MGKRKTAKQAPKRKKYILPTEFDCVFCDHKQCVDVKLQRALRKGTVKCRVCKKNFETGINHLHERADVYCAWMDQIEEGRRENEVPRKKKITKQEKHQQIGASDSDSASIESESDSLREIVEHN